MMLFKQMKINIYSTFTAIIKTGDCLTIHIHTGAMSLVWRLNVSVFIQDSTIQVYF